MSLLARLRGLTRRDAPGDDGSQARSAGNAALQDGRLDDALQHYDRYVAACPTQSAPHLNRGYVLLRLGRLDAAAAALRLACRYDPASHEALFFLARALAAAGDDGGAEQALAEAVRLQPGDVPSWVELGQVRERRSMPATARAAFERAAALQADSLPAWEGLARIALTQGDGHAALDAADRCLLLAPQSAQAAGMRADALLKLKRADEALAAIDAVLASAPALDGAQHVRAAALSVLRRHDDALAAYRSLVRNDPGDTAALRGLASALLAADRHADALPVLDDLLRRSPDDAPSLADRALALMQLLRLDEATAGLKAAVARLPDEKGLAFALSACELTDGDMAAGWRHYEARPLAAVHGAPRWHAGMDVAGRRVMLLSEQGLGDAIQFVRYVPAVLARGARSVVLQVSPRLAKLVDGQWPGCEIVTEPGAATGIDLYCPLLSLPHTLGLPDPLPMPAPYVHATAERRAHWRERLGDSGGGRVIGLVWSGNAAHAADRRRSIPLAMLRDAAPAGVRFISLQMDIAPDDRPAFESWPGGLLHVGREQADMADTGALIEQLDAVVSVDTSVAHLTGALGRPLLLLLHHCPDWRWRLRSDTTPWYPTARLFRQRSAGDWQPVVQAAMAALAQRGHTEEGR